MADNETTADIIAEIRALSNPISDSIIAINGRRIVDRLEAAHKRERGDCAKLREALDESRRIASDLGGCRLNDYWKLNEIVRVCDDALSAPPRNCDRFATADEAFHAWNNTVDTPGGGAYVGLMDWLFAPATEKEGGAK